MQSCWTLWPVVCRRTSTSGSLSTRLSFSWATSSAKHTWSIPLILAFISLMTPSISTVSVPTRWSKNWPLRQPITWSSSTWSTPSIWKTTGRICSDWQRSTETLGSMSASWGRLWSRRTRVFGMGLPRWMCCKPKGESWERWSSRQCSDYKLRRFITSWYTVCCARCILINWPRPIVISSKTCNPT